MDPSDHADGRLPRSDALGGLYSQARERAAELRELAMDDFWRGANALIEQRLDQAGRSARRLAARLAAHRQRNR